MAFARPTGSSFESEAVGCMPMNGCFVDRRIDSSVERRIDTRSRSTMGSMSMKAFGMSAKVNEGDRKRSEDNKEEERLEVGTRRRAEGSP